jgi:hypothetical protein
VARLALSVGEDEKPLSHLRHAEPRSVEDFGPDVIALALKRFDKGLVPLPAAHMDDVFYDDPARLEFPCERQNVVGGTLTVLVRWALTASAGMARALASSR